MAILSEVVELLRRWDIWKRVEESPGRIDALEARVAALEAKLSGPVGEQCPHCGERTFRVVSSHPHPRMHIAGVLERVVTCEACGFSEKQAHKTL